MNDEAFEQAGLRVCYKRATVSFPSGRTYPVTAIRPLRYENFLRPNQKKWFAYIEVENMEAIDQHYFDPRKGSYTPNIVDAATVVELQPIREC